jgi:hypothetical protein
MVRLAVLGLDLDGVGVDEPAGAGDGLDAATLQRPLQALVHLLDDVVLVPVERGDLDALVGQRDAVGLGVLGVLGDLGGLQDRLGGDAAPVQAGAADLRLLDQHDRQVELRGAQRRGVAAGAGRPR